MVKNIHHRDEGCLYLARKVKGVDPVPHPKIQKLDPWFLLDVGLVDLPANGDLGGLESGLLYLPVLIPPGVRLP